MDWSSKLTSRSRRPESSARTCPSTSVESPVTLQLEVVTGSALSRAEMCLLLGRFRASAHRRIWPASRRDHVFAVRLRTEHEVLAVSQQRQAGIAGKVIGQHTITARGLRTSDTPRRRIHARRGGDDGTPDHDHATAHRRVLDDRQGGVLGWFLKRGGRPDSTGPAVPQPAADGAPPLRREERSLLDLCRTFNQQGRRRGAAPTPAI
jgi:hypothetical protein